MMKVKAIISDLDGTLLNEHHSISDYTRKTLKRAMDAGYKILIATGRHHVDLGHIVKNEIKLPLFRVSANGSRSYSPQDDLLYNETIGPELVEKIIRLKFPAEVFTHLYQGDDWFCDKEDKISLAHQAMSGFIYKNIDYSRMTDFSDVMKICYICRDGDRLKEVDNVIKEEIGDKLNLSFTLPVCYEVFSKNADKAKAISHILQMEGIKPEETIAFGDGMNDLNMLRLSGKALIMGNALPMLKAAMPEAQVIGPNSGDAVARYIEKNLL